MYNKKNTRVRVHTHTHTQMERESVCVCEGAKEGGKEKERDTNTDPSFLPSYAVYERLGKVSTLPGLFPYLVNGIMVPDNHNYEN